jgi:signal-transduction protein with cAMP-binding, CBS, and nucleotidyltransferase domain
LIKYFLNKYTKYGYFEGDKDSFLTKLSTSMHIESFPKDYLLFRKNDIGDKFYIILKGKVAIVINQDIFIDMTQREYYIHFEKLRYFKEYYLLERLLSYENSILLPCHDI